MLFKIINLLVWFVMNAMAAVILSALIVMGQVMKHFDATFVMEKGTLMKMMITKR